MAVELSVSAALPLAVELTVTVALPPAVALHPAVDCALAVALALHSPIRSPCSKLLASDRAD